MGFVILHGDTYLNRDGTVTVTVMVQGPDFNDEVRVKMEDSLGLGSRQAQHELQEAYATRAIRLVAEAISKEGTLTWQVRGPGTAEAVLELAPPD